MKGIRKGKVVQVLFSFSLILTLAVLLSVGYANAQDSELINPDQTFNLVTLLQGQSTGSISVSQAAPFGLNTVGVVSIGNRSLSSSISITSKDARGFWIMYAIGTGPVTWRPFSFGLVPWSGPGVTINLRNPRVQRVSYALFFTSLFLTSPVSADAPVSYSVSINATQ